MSRLVRLKKRKIYRKAFSRGRAVDTPRLGVLYGERGADAEALALFPLTPLTEKTIKESAFYLSYLEEAICDFKAGGYKKGHRLAKKEFRDFLKGVSC